MTIAHNPEHGWYVMTNVDGWPGGSGGGGGGDIIYIDVPIPEQKSIADIRKELQQAREIEWAQNKELRQENERLKAEIAQLRAERKCMCGDKTGI